MYLKIILGTNDSVIITHAEAPLLGTYQLENWKQIKSGIKRTAPSRGYILNYMMPAMKCITLKVEGSDKIRIQSPHIIM